MADATTAAKATGGFLKKAFNFSVIAIGVTGVLALTSGIGSPELLQQVFTSGDSLALMDVPKMAVEGASNLLQTVGWVGDKLGMALGTTNPFTSPYVA
jgi:hypothetical protein